MTCFTACVECLWISDGSWHICRCCLYAAPGAEAGACSGTVESSEQYIGCLAWLHHHLVPFWDYQRIYRALVGQGWIWLSLGLLIAIYVSMGIAALGYYSQVRKAVGLAYMQSFKPQPPGEVASAEEIDALLNHPFPAWLAVVGFGSLTIIAWLMMVKWFYANDYRHDKVSR